MKSLLLAVDVDEVCADLLGEWLRRYNKDHGDNLTPDDISEWDLSKLVRCGGDIYNYLHQPDLYEHVLPISGARPAIYTLLSMGHRVVYATSCPSGTAEFKRSWLLRWGFLTPANASRDFLPVSDKSLIHADYLFDDRPENIEGFTGTGVLIRRAHNQPTSHNRCPHQIGGLREAPKWLENQEYWARYTAAR